MKIICFSTKIEHWGNAEAHLLYEMILQLCIWKLSMYFYIQRETFANADNYNLTRELAFKRTIEPKKKAMWPLKGSTSTTLASKWARAGSNSVWQREEQEMRVPHLPENVALDGNWCKLLTSDSSCSAQGIRGAPRVQIPMGLKGKPTLSLLAWAYLQQSRTQRHHQHNKKSHTRLLAPVAKTPRRHQAFGRDGYSTSTSSCPKGTSSSACDGSNHYAATPATGHLQLQQVERKS